MSLIQEHQEQNLMTLEVFDFNNYILKTTSEAVISS